MFDILKPSVREQRRDAMMEAKRADEERIAIAAQWERIKASPPRVGAEAKVVKTRERIITEHEWDLGALEECEQVLIEDSDGWPIVHDIVTLPGGRKARLAGGSYSGGKHGTNGWSDTRYMDDGAEGPSLRFEDGRILYSIRYGSGSGHCRTIDRLRAKLDENTGEPIIDADAA